MSKIKQYVIWSFYSNTLMTVMAMVWAGLYLFNYETASIAGLIISVVIYAIFAFYVKKKLQINVLKKNALELATDEREKSIINKINADLIKDYTFIISIGFGWGLLFLQGNDMSDFAFTKGIFILWAGIAFFLPSYRYLTRWYKYDKEY
ncbi:hypothetical protein G6R29_03785 [Fructobacillus sp. M2-14]|uniref:DUF2178 domain-containing protein n=1 Tax=Fructobacillus broussonetiae TaxID=2713173 RepID=A0ABS5R2G6_9LACO|nr:hypothetical protein [Fructobacillus broussonetiae]MBS9338744.1 hypothetical protein [Fructobacillus broussonetiae]